mgnify:CR=1 FL=1
MTKIVPYEAPADADGDDHEVLGRPFRVVARLRNNRLIRAREALGYASCRQAVEKIGVSYTTLINYESLSKSPWDERAKEGGWSPSARKIADAYAYHPEELWPEVMKDVRARAAVLELSEPTLSVAVDRRLDYGELRGVVQKQLATLRPADREVLERRFGLNGREAQTLEGVAASLSSPVNRERARQIEARGLRNLRHPSLANALKPFVGGEPKVEAVHPQGITCLGCGAVLDEGVTHRQRQWYDEDRGLLWVCDRTEKTGRRSKVRHP